MTKKLFVLLVLCFALSCSVGFCSAEKKTYTMTEQELTKLETIFQQLESNNEKLSVDLKLSKAELATLKSQLTVLTLQSQQAKQSLTTAQASLQKANESLQAYASEIRDKERRWKREKILLLTALAYCVLRST